MTAMEPDPELELSRLADEFTSRLRAGEAATPQEYAEAHPALAERILGLFPMLGMMEGAKAQTTVGGAALPDAVAGAHPDQVGPYRIVREIGRGGMGRVFEGRDEDDRRVAVKVIHPHLVSKRTFVDRFLREAEIGRTVHHPGLVPTLGSGRVAWQGVDVPYLVLEYVEGRNLRSLIEEHGQVPERLCRHIGRCVADALSAVHDQGVVHRDVKAENVVITPTEEVRLMDLGVALVLEEQLRLSQTGEFVGSLLYAAPEQLRGQDLDGRADLYGLGLMLFELITGHHPGSGGGSPLGRTLGDLPSDVQQDAPETSDFLAAIVRTLMHADRTQRFQDAAEVAQVLGQGETGTWWRKAGSDTRGVRAWAQVPADLALIGRDAELATLDEALSESRRGVGGTVLVEGEAGIGKSRLLRAWADRAAERDPLLSFLVVEHAPGGEDLGIPAIAEALRTWFGDENLEARLEEILGPGSCMAGPLVRHMRGEEAGAFGQMLPPAALVTAYVMVLRGIARRHGLVVIVEDLHFAGEEERKLFERLARSIATEPILIVGTTRPVNDAFRHDWRALPHVQVLTVQGLAPRAAESLLTAATDDPARPDRVARWIAASDGNPLCLIEFARDGGPESETSAGTLPERIRQLIEARLEDLEPEDHELLPVAACAGFTFDPLLVLDALQAPRIAGLKRFMRLEREQGLLVSEGALYRFQHHTVHEALLQDMPDALRATCHGMLARARSDALVRQGKTPQGADAVAIAMDALRGDAPVDAAPVLETALDSLSMRGEVGTALRLAQRTFEHVEVLPEPAVALAHVMVAEAGYTSISMDQCLEHLDQAQAWLDTQPVDSRRVRLEMARGTVLRMAGRTLECIEVLERALALAGLLDETNDPWGPQAQAKMNTIVLTSLTTAYRFKGDLEAAVASGERAYALASELEDERSRASAGHVLAEALAELGRREEALAYVDEGMEIAERYGERRQRAVLLSMKAKLAYLTGDFEAAAAVLEENLGIGREIGDDMMVLTSHINRVHMALDAGSPEPARHDLEAAQAIANDKGWKELQGHLKLLRGNLFSHEGRIADAHACFRAFRVDGERIDHAGMRVRGSLSEAITLAWMGRFEEAHARIDASLAEAEAQGMVAEVGYLLVVRAMTWELAGQAGRARAALPEMQATVERSRQDRAARELDLLASRVLPEEDAADEAMARFAAWARQSGHVPWSRLADTWDVLREASDGDAVRAEMADLVADGRVNPSIRLSVVSVWSARRGHPEAAVVAADLARQHLAGIPEDRRADARRLVEPLRVILALDERGKAPAAG